MLQTTWRCVLSTAEPDRIRTILQGTLNHMCLLYSRSVQPQQQLRVIAFSERGKLSALWSLTLGGLVC